MSKSEFKPLKDRVVVRRLIEDSKTAGGIVIPDTAKEKPSRGEVLAVGPGTPLENGDVRALSVKVGDKVLFGKYAGTEIKHQDKELVIMREDDLLAVIED